MNYIPLLMIEIHYLSLLKLIINDITPPRRVWSRQGNQWRYWPMMY